MKIPRSQLFLHSLAYFASVHARIGSRDTVVTCEMLETDYTFASPAAFEKGIELEDEWNCVDLYDDTIIYNLDGVWMQRLFSEHNVRSGAVFTFRGISIRPEVDPIYDLPTIVLYDNSEIKFVSGDANSVRRKLSIPTSGELEVLIVRVTDASGEEPEMDRMDISNRIFGIFGNDVSIKSQFSACSGGQLDLVPSSRTSSIEDGVLELPIKVNVADFDHWQRKSLEKVVNKELKNEGYNVRSFGLVMYIMPETTNLGFNGVLGYAYVNGVKSVYRGVPSFSTVMHEVGHNLGLAHSGLEDANLPFFEREYGDATCQMGFSQAHPHKCYNGVKSYDLGWYNKLKTGHENLENKSSWRGKLVGVHDYFGESYDGDGCEGHRVIANIGSLYIMFNRAESFTKDAPANDLVTVTEKMNTNNKDHSARKVNGILSKNDVRTFETLSGEKFTVMVCNISVDNTNPSTLDYADVIIFQNDGSIYKSCDTEASTSTCDLIETTVGPTGRPTNGPTSSPTDGPTNTPTDKPTRDPTNEPTSGPTDDPTVGITDGPTSSPSSIDSQRSDEGGLEVSVFTDVQDCDVVVLDDGNKRVAANVPAIIMDIFMPLIDKREDASAGIQDSRFNSSAAMIGFESPVMIFNFLREESGTGAIRLGTRVCTSYS